MFAIRDTASRSYKFRSPGIKAAPVVPRGFRPSGPIILQFSFYNSQEQLSRSHAAEGVPPLLVAPDIVLGHTGLDAPQGLRRGQTSRPV